MGNFQSRYNRVDREALEIEKVEYCQRQLMNPKYY